MEFEEISLSAKLRSGSSLRPNKRRGQKQFKARIGTFSWHAARTQGHRDIETVTCPVCANESGSIRSGACMSQDKLESKAAAAQRINQATNGLFA